MVHLLTLLWLFNPAQPATSVLTPATPRAEFVAPANTTNGFTLRLRLKLSPSQAEHRILEIPQVLQVVQRQHDPRDRRRQNYPAFKMPDGSVPVLEATLTLHSVEHPEWTNMTVGVPIALLRNPLGEHEVVVHFTGARWSLYVDGELLDNDFPFGYPRWPEGSSWSLAPEAVKRAELFAPALAPEKAEAQPSRPAPGIQYWLPYGHNNWVGDVATIFHRGRYHVFYLYDRRHHQSKFGCGAHYFEHLSTLDFKTWTEHDAATPLEEQWECIGTGTPFALGDQLGLSYGLHTTRVYPSAKTTLPAQWAFLEKHGHTGAFARTNTPGFPAGSTYAVSPDGLDRFRKSQVMFHPCENPSVFTDSAGPLRMLANFHAKGIWESPAIDGDWRCVSPDFPPGGDCTFFFRWGKLDYILGGFTRLWSKPAAAPDSAYEDVVRQGLDFYDGLNVPSITEVAGGRFLMSGWIPIRGWGGTLVFRELLQLPNGRIGSKWMPEIIPGTGTARMLADRVVTTTPFPTDTRSFLLTFEVHPTAATPGRVGVSFRSADGGPVAAELQIRPKERRAQFAAASPQGFGGPEKSLHEGGAPQGAGNYAIENLLGVDQPFAVRVLVLGSDKLGGSILDAEIAGQRTMISYRPDLTVTQLLVRAEGVELRRLQIAPLEAPGH